MLIHDMPFPEYLELDRASAHALALLHRTSPAHLAWNRDNPKAPNASQALGTLTHAAILEPDDFAPLVPPAVNKRTKAGKEKLAEWHASLPEGSCVAEAEDVAKAVAMRDAVMSQPYARALLADGSSEVTALWTDSELDVECKARFDRVCNGHEAILDIKTARSAAYDDFRRDAARFSYHLQAAHYLAAAEACDLGERAFIFVVVESEPPHGVALYQLDPQALHVGHVHVREALEVYAECKRTGRWPSYPKEIRNLSLPVWAMK